MRQKSIQRINGSLNFEKLGRVLLSLSTWEVVGVPDSGESLAPEMQICKWSSEQRAALGKGKSLWVAFNTPQNI